MADPVIYVKPAPGLAIRDPLTMRRIPPAGAFVERNGTVRMHIADKSLVECAPPEPGTEAAAAPAKSEATERRPRS